MGKNLKGIIILVICAFIWGNSFAAQNVIANNHIGIFTYLCVRSFICVIFLSLIYFIKNLIAKSKKSLFNIFKQKKKLSFIYIFNAGLLCGFCVAMVALTQQGGMNLYPEGVAASGRSAFITASYVIMVALTERLLGKKTHPIIYCSSIICFLGIALISLSNGIDKLYFSDFLTFLCAIFNVIQILAVDHYSDIDSILLCDIEFLVCFIIALPLMLIFDRKDFPYILNCMPQFLFMGIGSGGIAYTLQIEGQKYVFPAVAVLCMSLEAVFGALSGAVFLNQHFSTRETLGAILVFLSICISQLPDIINIIKHPNKKPHN